VGSLAFLGRGLLLGGSGGACPTHVVTATGRELPAGRAAVRTAVAPASGSLGACLGLERARTVALVRAGAEDAGAGSRLRRAGRSLVAVAPVGDRGCAALLRGGHGRAVVAQAVRGDGTITVRRVPRALHATALFFCRRHVNVLGAHGHRLGLLALPARTGH
jgi:hypothetical protein